MKTKMQFKKVRTRMTSWFLAAALVPLVIVVGVIYGQRVRSIKQEAFNKLTAIRDLKVHEVNTWLDERIGDIRTISQDYEMRGLEGLTFTAERAENESKGKIVRELLNNYVENYRDYYSFSVLTSSGIVALSTDRSQEGTDKSKDPYFFEPMQTGQIFVKDVYFSKTLNVVSMAISAPIYCLAHSGEHMIGILVARVDLESSLYSLLLNRTGMGETGETLIVNQDVLALNELRWYEHAPLKLRIQAEPAIHASQGETGITETADYRGEKVLAAYTYIPKTKWGFVAKEDQKEIYAPIRTMLWNLLILFVVSGVVVYGLAVFLAGSISRPIVEMTEVARKIQKGDLTARNRVVSADEFGYLAETFNKMTDSIGSQIATIKKVEDELRQERDTLEEQVQERTASLQSELEERERVEGVLRESEERFRLLVEGVADYAIFMLDPGGHIVSWNPGAERIKGYKAEEIIGQHFSCFYPKNEIEAKKPEQELETAISEGQFQEEGWRLRKDGSRFWASVVIAALRDEDGSLQGFSKVTRDVTQRRQAEEQIKASLKEKEVLLREIHHRVKNNMQVITSLLKLQAGHFKDKEYLDMFEESQGRIRSMALVHEKLYQSGDLAHVEFDGYVKTLAKGLFRAHGVDPGKIGLKINVENVPLGLDNAVPCGLIINELVSNSLKYAFPQDKGGEIGIDLHSINGDQLELRVSDDGIGLPEDLDFRKTESLGLHLVTILAEDQLEGKVELNRDRGTRYSIQFKMQRYKARV